MDISFQSIVVALLLAGAVGYIIRKYTHKKKNAPPCSGCASGGGECDCPLVKEKLHQL